MKLLSHTIIILFTLVFFTKKVNAQSYTINQGGTISTCVGNFFDSDSTANYQNNENYTITFCSNGGGNIINVSFSALFDIDPSDTLFVYDGNSIASPLIGKYNNSNAPAGVSSTTANLTGCLTFQFISDGAVVAAGWSGAISCLTICQPILPVISTIPALINYGPDSTYTNICPGDTVFFNATGTYPDNGANPFNYAQSDATSTFEWSLGTGTTVIAQSTSEVYPNPQGYFIILKVTDANGCVENVTHKVRTGVPPNFSGIFPQPDTACFGDPINLIGGFNATNNTSIGVSSNTGVVSAGGTVAGQTFLPDGSGVSYSTSVNISGFGGQTIQNGSDISQVCLNIEHSYIGDLTIELSCPNGTTITLSNTYAGTSPGGTFLGDALDDGSTNPGIGMDYCFDLGATWGTMNTENNNSNWIPSTVTPGNNILTPGSFQPEQSFNALIGCPIDGNWSIIVTDNLNIDNGYIFEWSILLNPAINPNAEFYTVGITNGIWLPDPDITNYYDSLAITIPDSAGIKPYTFQVTDEYGCTFDTTIQVFVLPQLNPIASPDTTLCAGQQVTLDINIIDTCTYTLTLYDSFGDGWNGALLDVLINGTPFLSGITVPNCGSFGSGCTSTFNIPVTSGDIITMNYTGGSFDNENDITLFDAGGTQIFTINNPPAGAVGGSTTAMCGALVNYLWNPATNLSDPTIKNPIFSGTSTTTYTVTIAHANFPQCNATSNPITVNVQNITPPFVTGDSILCLGTTITLSVTNATSYLWSDGSTSSSVTFTPTADTTISVSANNFCDTLNLTKNIIVNSPPTIVVSPDTSIVIKDTVGLTLTGGDTTFSYLWSPPDGLACVTCPQPNASPTATTTYSVTVTDTNGCTANDVVTVTVLIPDLFIPTGFSPNGDGINDVVFVRSLDIKTMVFQIFDRWGGLVFETTNQKNGWDGTYKGKKLDFGVYVYKFEATLLSGKKITKSGSITLFK